MRRKGCGEGSAWSWRTNSEPTPPTPTTATAMVLGFLEEEEEEDMVVRVNRMRGKWRVEMSDRENLVDRPDIRTILIDRDYESESPPILGHDSWSPKS